MPYPDKPLFYPAKVDQVDEYNGVRYQTLPMARRPGLGKQKLGLKPNQVTLLPQRNSAQGTD